jgi:hypothetical protein
MDGRVRFGASTPAKERSNLIPTPGLNFIAHSNFRVLVGFPRGAEESLVGFLENPPPREKPPEPPIRYPDAGRISYPNPKKIKKIIGGAISDYAGIT